MSEFCTPDDLVRWQEQWASDGLGGPSEGDYDLINAVTFGSQPEVCRVCLKRPATLWVGFRSHGQNLTETCCVHCLIDREDAVIGSAWNGTTWSRVAIDVLARDQLISEYARMHPATTSADQFTVDLLWTRSAPDDPAAGSDGANRWSWGLVSRLERFRDLLDAARVG